MALNLQPLSPEWFVVRLHKQIAAQAKAYKVLNAYYCGEHPLPWLAPQAQDDFRRILRMTRSNYMGLVIDAMVERMNLEGFRIDDEPEADSEMWRIWQANHLDGYFDQALLEAAISGVSFMQVEPNPADERTPRIYVEHCTQAAVEFVPGTNRRERAASVKLWRDDWTGRLFSTLQLAPQYGPDGKAYVLKYESEKPYGDDSLFEPEQVRWRPRSGAEDFAVVNPLGEVSMHELANNPRLLSGGVSEIADLIDIQDRVNKTIADRLMTQDFGAFPQKWASGWPETDEQGAPSKPINVGRDRMVTTDVPEARFGQWDAAPLDPYSGAKREDVKDIASRSRTPAQYLLGEMSNVNGETLKASESGLVSKSRQRMRNVGENVEGVARTTRRAAGLPEPKTVETIWRNPEFRTEGELVDALVKMSGLGVPYEALWERWGASQNEMKRWREMQERQDAIVLGVTGGTGVPAGGGGPVQQPEGAGANGAGPGASAVEQA